MNKLQIINNSINEIREILGAECTSIEQLPELVRARVNDTSRNGFTTAFVFSSDLHPARPTGGSLDTTTGLVVGLDGNWSQTGISNTKTRLIETAKIWMSFNIFDPSGNPILEEWTEPVNLKGDKGATGEQGEVGANGPMGPKGETGHAVSFRTVSVYTDTETLDTPSNPIGGFWNFTTNEVTPPTSETGVTWYLNADIPNRKKYLWLSQATFDESGSILNDWCRPFRLTGEDGEDGVDGQVTEFIYRCLPNMKAYDALKLYLKDNKLESKNESEFIPETEDHIGGTEWSDSPTGITEALPIEVCCTRVRKSINDSWGPWSNCIIWAKWGEDGMDGDGVEYIYLVTEPRVNGEKITSEIIANPQFGYMPSRYEATLRADYQDDEFCFNETWGYEGYEWTDEPSDVGPDQPLEWVSIRKKKNGVWGEFSDPQLWATFSENGAAYLTSFVFTRAAIDNPPQRPAGGNIDNPMPILTPEWKDSVPMEFPDLPVWISKRTFKSGDDNWDDWNEPKILSDSPDFQVEYCAKQQRPSALTPFTGDEIAWRREQADVWGDDDTIVDPVWMATTIKKGGIWSPWVVTQIKGEKGDKGENGTSVSMKGKVATKQELLDAWDSYVNGGPFLSFNVDLIAGESIFVEEDGHLYIYSGGFYPGEDDVTFEKYWTSVLIQGEPGKNAYLYLAYTDELNPDVDIWIDPGHVAKYIGMFYSDEVYSKEALLDYNLYTWTRWSGEDGWGYEQIFLLTHKDLPYHPNGYHCPLPVKEEGDNTPGYLPHHPFANGAKPFEPETRWSDTPLSPDEEYPFCWVATRKVNGTEYSAWKGNTDRTASLYSRYTVDGVSGVYIELSNDYVFIPLEDGAIDPDFLQGVSEGTMSPVKTVVRAYIGDEPVNSLQIGIEGEHIVVEGSTVFLNLDEIDSSITEIPLRITVGDRTYDKSWKLFYTTTGYTISADSIVLKRGNMDGKLLDDILNVSITKWDGQKFINTGIPLFAKVYFDNGSEVQILSVEDGEISESDGGRAVVDLTKIANYPTKLHLYVVEPDADGNYRSDANEIAFQDVGVVFDGKNTFTINLTNDLGIIPLEEDGTIDSQAPDVTTTIQMYESEELVPATYSVNIKSNAISVNDVGNVIVKPALFENAENVPKEIICSATYRGITLTRIFKLNVTKNAYELFTDSNILPRDPYSGILIDSDIRCELRRWNSVDNVYELPSNITDLYVHAECRHLDDEDCPDSSRNVANNARFNENGFATVDLRDEVNLIYFRLYVSAESTLEAAKNNWLTYEDVAVTADGSSSLHLELSNDFTMIATDDKGVPDANWDEESDEGQDLAYSEAKLYVGTVEASNATYSWEIISGEGTLEDADTDKCSLVTLTTDSATIRCTATYEGTSIWKDFNVIKSKGQPVYKLVSSANLFTYGKDGSNTATPSKITFSVSKWTGSQYETVSDLSTEGLTLTNASGTSITEISPSKNNVTVYLKKGDVIIDQETIGYVEGGSKGSDALHLELSNDFTMVPTDSNGNVDTSWDEESDAGQDLAISTASLYLGVNKIDSSKVTWNWTVVEGSTAGTLEDATTDTCSVLTMNRDAITVRCTATYNGGSISKDLNVVKSKGQAVYKLVPSASVFAYNKAGVPNPSTITIKILKWDNGSYSEVNAVTEGLTLSHIVLTAQKASQTVTLKKGSVILDQETIGYIESGVDGVITDAEKGRIEQAVREAVLTTTQNNLNDAKTELSGKITAANTALETAKTNLQTAIDNEKEARESGDTAAAQAAAKALKEAQEATANAAAYVKRLETVEGSITNLDSKIDTETGKIRDSVLTEEQVYDLSIAALGSKAKVPEGSIAADSVFGQYFAGTVGVFGDLIADQVTATKISGALKDSDLQQLSIYSGTKYDDSAWALEKSGAGKIANGQISWNADGSEVTLGSNVKLTWDDNIDGKPSIPSTSDIQNQIDTSIEGIEFPEGMTEEEAKQITRTVITSETIEAPNLKVNAGNIKDLTVESISGLKDLVAEEVEAKEVSTNVLYTNGEDGAGTIKIEGNDIEIFKKDSTEEVIRISGEDWAFVPNIRYPKSGNTATYIPSPGFLGMSFLELDKNYAYQKRGNAEIVGIGSYTITSNSIYEKDHIFRVGVGVYMGQSLHDQTHYYTSNSSGTFVTTTNVNVSLPNSINSGSESYGWLIFVGCMIDNVSIPCTYSNNVYTGTYKTGSEKFTFTFTPYIDVTTSLYYEPVITPRTDVSATGIRKIQDVNNYVLINDDCDFEARRGNYGFRINSNGIQVMNNGSTWKSIDFSKIT